MLIKKNIRSLSIEELSVFFKKHGIAKFRAKQVYEWLWKKKVINFDEMTSLSITDRELLKNYFCLVNEQRSNISISLRYFYYLLLYFYYF